MKDVIFSFIGTGLLKTNLYFVTKPHSAIIDILPCQISVLFVVLAHYKFNLINVLSCQIGIFYMYLAHKLIFKKNEVISKTIVGRAHEQ